MKLSVLALDYDGTIARNDRLDPDVLDAITYARRRKVIVLLVTGRILEELRRVAGDLDFVDGVVAENGAVLHIPTSGHTTLLAPPIPPSFLSSLEDRALRFAAGRCLVDADAGFAHAMLDVIRELELPIVLLFNRSRVMALPQGVSKATGLSAALGILRVSPRNTVAIGDAENDYELLRFAEVGAAVEWGSRSLQAAADVVIEGAGPASVADFIRRVAASGHLPLPARARRRLAIGTTADGGEFSLGVRNRNVLITGDTNSGKSWLAGLLCERLILHGYSLCVIDPEGDYTSLGVLPGTTVLGGEDEPPALRVLLHELRHPERSVVIDLSRLRHEDKCDYVRTVLPALNVMRRRTGTPHRIIIDEAHYFLRDAVERGLLDLEFNGYTVVTYWPSRLPPSFVAQTGVILVTRESSADEIAALRDHCDACRHRISAAWETLPHLRLDQAVALPTAEESSGELRTFTIGERLTPHVRHRTKYVDVPVSDRRAFVFGSGDKVVARARTLREFVDVFVALAPAAAAAYLRRGDPSRWIADVFGDHTLACELQGYERRYAMTEDPEALRLVARAITERYELAAPTLDRG